MFYLKNIFLCFMITMSILSLSAQSISPLIGNPESFTYTHHIPAEFYYKNSLSQTLYYANEINAEGIIVGLKYLVTLHGDIPNNTPLKIWMANTNLNSYETNSSWISQDEFTLVFDDSVDLSANCLIQLIIPFQQPFNYLGGNLCIMVNRPMDTVYYSSQNQFLYTETPQFPNRTIYFYSDETEALPGNPPEGTMINQVPNTILLMQVNGLGIVSGTVTNQSNNQPIENARVTITGTSRFAITNAQGQYNLSYLSPGTIGLTILNTVFMIPLSMILRWITLNKTFRMSPSLQDL